MVTYNTQVPVPGSQRLGGIFKAVSILLLALGVMALALSGSLVVNTVSALLTQQVRQVGIMKAIGGGALQIGTLFLALVAIYGLLAVLIGLPVGAYWASWFAKFAGGLLDFGPASTLPPVYAVELAVAVGFLVPLLAALLPIRSGTRVSVVTALNATGMTGADFGHGTVDRMLGRLRGLSRPVALSLRNTFLRKGRLAMTLTTLILASAVVTWCGCRVVGYNRDRESQSGVGVAPLLLMPQLETAPPATVRRTAVHTGRQPAQSVRTIQAPMGLHWYVRDGVGMLSTLSGLCMNVVQGRRVLTFGPVFKTVVGGEEPPGCVRFARASAR